MVNIEINAIIRYMKTPLQFLHPDDTKGEIAARLRATRLRLGWKQSTLADRSGVSLPTIRRYESTGQTSMSNFLNLCFALGLLDEVGELFQTTNANSIAELEAMTSAHKNKRQRGTK